jgi:N-acetylglucosamine-6-sulfatase
MKNLNKNLTTIFCCCFFLFHQEISAGNKPNFIIIITDDQPNETIHGFMPQTESRIFGAGVTFTNAFVTTPLCCPSRSSILTGLYASRHLVQTNDDTLYLSTVAQSLHEAGYKTGMVGKYLNSWDGTPKPEFDYWIAQRPGRSDYYSPILNLNGAWVQHTGYTTRILKDYVLDFLDSVKTSHKPFFLLFAPDAPHAPANPWRADTSLYADLPPYRPSSYNEKDVSDKPNWIQQLPLLDFQTQARVDSFRLNQLRTLWALDGAIGEILDTLNARQLLEQTVIFFISDNGYLYGEHRLIGKNKPYEGAIHIPFGMRYSNVIPAGKTISKLVANIDIAPTIHQLAGLEPSVKYDGQSLMNLLTDTAQWRSELLIEAWPSSRPFSAIRTEQYIYIETFQDSTELYDLALDPDQLQNRVHDEDYSSVRKQLKFQLDSLRLLITNIKEPTLFDSTQAGVSPVQVFPNPFNLSTTITVNLLEYEHTQLNVFDSKGSLLGTFFDKDLPPGKHSIKFSADNLASGVYFYQIRTENNVFYGKLLLAK